MDMKLSELKKQIKDNIYEILSDVNEATYMGADSADDLQKDPKFAAAKDKTAAINTLKAGGSVTLQEEDEDTTPDDDILDKQAAAAVNKKDSITTASSKLQKLVTKMKGLAKEYKSAEGDKKEKIKDELKKLTSEKKALEKTILPSEEED